MNRIQNSLIELIKSAINHVAVKDIIVQQDEWQELYSLIIKQGMDLILFPLIDELAETYKPKDKIYQQWHNRILYAATLQFRRVHQLKAIIDGLNAANLAFLVIKGPAIARYYDHPEYRLMSDLDILVEPHNLLSAQQAIEAMGYSLVVDEEDHPFHLGYAKKGSLYIELHYSLLRPDILGKRKMDAWYQHIWSSKKDMRFDTAEFHVMAEEDELINQVLHFARHMISQGAALKNLFDMALIIKHCEKELDWEYIKSQMERLNLLKFGSVIFTICNKRFDVNAPENVLNQTSVSADEFLDMFINDFTAEIVDGTEFQRTWANLSRTAPLLCKSLITLPIVFIIDLLLQLTMNKKGLFESFSLTNRNIKKFAERVRILRTLGLVG